MQTHNLELSNIEIKYQHFLPQGISPNFNFELEPITHKSQRREMQTQKIQPKNTDLKNRKQSIEKSQRMRKKLVLQKIAERNQRFQLRQQVQKQNKNLSQISSHLSKKKLNQISSKKGFNPNGCEDEMIRKIVNQQNLHVARKVQLFKEIKLRDLKLPQLNSGIAQPIKKTIKNKQDQNSQDEFQAKIKEPKEKVINPILKVHDTRYFGIEEMEQNFQKMGKSMLKLIRRKYWCYQSLESEAIYENFENLINDNLD